MQDKDGSVHKRDSVIDGDSDFCPARRDGDTSKNGKGSLDDDVLKNENDEIE